MTVIAYSARLKIMASDSRLSDEHETHFTSIKKIYRLKNGALYGSAGDSDDREIRALLSKSSPRNLPSRSELLALKIECKALIVFPKGQCYSVEIEFEDEKMKDWTASVDLVTDPIVAVGSGYQFALGAMECGATPMQAVRATCRRDLRCALPVQYERLELPSLRKTAN